MKKKSLKSKSINKRIRSMLLLLLLTFTIMLNTFDASAQKTYVIDSDSSAVVTEANGKNTISKLEVHSYRIIVSMDKKLVKIIDRSEETKDLVMHIINAEVDEENNITIYCKEEIIIFIVDKVLILKVKDSNDSALFFYDEVEQYEDN